VQAGGGHVVEPHEAEGLIWLAGNSPEHLDVLLEDHPEISWVQLPWAGIEPFLSCIDDERTWTCGKGVYSEPVAEMALGLALAGMRCIGSYARAAEWSAERGRNLVNANVTILGGGGITHSLLHLLRPFDCHITVVRNRVQEMPGANDVVEADRYVDAITGADLVVLALALTPDTEGMISRVELEMMEPHAWLVNVARGKHIVTDDLVWALQNGVIGGAGLDVTDPEPLPAGHPLWALDNCIITPHAGSTPALSEPGLAKRITENVARFIAGQPLLGRIDSDLGY
jgi:phosphoglycerate dehydrogenase-like enzyme